MFEGMDIKKLFKNSEYAKNFTFRQLTEEMILREEEKTGYKLPASYKEFLRVQNGGCIDSDNWELSCIFGISEDGSNGNSLENQYDNWIEEWGYPEIGIPFAMTESGGHEIYFMDYRKVDENGEPRIIRIDQESDYAEYFIADNFEAFLRKIFCNEELSEESLTEREKTPEQKKIDQLKMQWADNDGNDALCRGGVFFSIIGIVFGIIKAKYILTGICLFVMVLSVVYLIKYEKNEKRLKKEMGDLGMDVSRESLLKIREEMKKLRNGR